MRKYGRYHNARRPQVFSSRVVEHDGGVSDHWTNFAPLEKELRQASRQRTDATSPAEQSSEPEIPEQTSLYPMRLDLLSSTVQVLPPYGNNPEMKETYDLLPDESDK